MVELLSPVGDFECLKSAVQNGADAVYFGANLFSARAFATNFDNTQLQQAINYAKLRGVKTHLALNTLIKNNEFESAFNIAKQAYNFGIDAIIVQDLGLALTLIKNFPDLDIHASTQMTTTNLQGVHILEKLGFKRVVLSRETTLKEIENICKNSDIEIEVFMHGALCISYSGQCLFSSMVGGRSGNRGECAQPCRLPYSLLVQDNEAQSSKTLDKGYLLSTRDLCTLDYLPPLIKAGVKSFKIEGRMKSPIYVATVTRIYRKYIDLAIKFNNHKIDNYSIDEKDKQDLLQVFNRGGFSEGHLSSSPNKELVYKSKPNNMGIYIGKIEKYNKNKGLISTKLKNSLAIGDSISFDKEPTKYTISELMVKNINIKKAIASQSVTFGRMKGNININDKIYKISDKELSDLAINSYSKEFRISPLYCKLDIHLDKKIDVFVKSLLFNLDVTFTYDFIPDVAQNAPISKEKILAQFNKTLNTCFYFSDIEINLDDNLFIPTSILNDIRREAISKIEDKILCSFARSSNAETPTQAHTTKNLPKTNIEKFANSSKINKSLLLNILQKDFDYSKLKCVDRIYIPLKYFCNADFKQIINILSKKSKLYIYMPNVVKDEFWNVIKNSVNTALNEFEISGAVISNISELSLFKNYQLENYKLRNCTSENCKFDLIANYTMNLYNNFTAQSLSNLGLKTITVSPELKNTEISEFCNSNPNSELIVYGTIPLMTMNYCLLGSSDKCYNNCTHQCLSSNKFYLKDRYNFTFRVIPDNSQTISTIYNSRKIDVDYSALNVSSIRFDILDETIEQINDL